MACSQEEEQHVVLQLCKRLNTFQADFPTASLNSKANVMGNDLITFLTNHPEAINTYEDMGPFTESLATHWIMAPNPKVVLYGLEALMIIADTLQARYKPYSSIVMPQCISRLGDTKENLREKARLYLIKTVEVGANSPGFMFDKMSTLFSHKNINLVPEAQKVISGVYQFVQTQNITLSHDVVTKLIRIAIKGMAIHGRDEAEALLMDLSESSYSGLVLIELEKIPKEQQGSLRGKKLMALLKTLNTKRMELQAQQIASMRKSPPPKKEEKDEPDLSAEQPKRATAAEKLLQTPLHALESDSEPGSSYLIKPAVKGAIPKLSANTMGLASTGMTNKKTMSVLKSGSIKRDRLVDSVTYALHSGPAGEADEAWFHSAFEDVVPVVCLNHREFDTLIKKIIEDLKSGAEFWERKVDAFKKLRAILLHLPQYEDDLILVIKNNYLLIVNGFKDLRSQVVRETCLTYSFFCKELKNKLDTYSCEIILIQLLFNVMSSAKVIASASTITLKFMFTHITHGRLISTLSKEMNFSKSPEVRKISCELLELLLSKWPVNRLEQNIPVLQEFIKRGVSETSSEGRMAARKAFLQFCSYFPAQGEALLQSLDSVARKQVETARMQHMKNEDKQEPSSKRQAKQPAPRQAYVAPTDSVRRATPKPVVQSKRSASYIDVQAAQRARARQEYAALNRQKIGSNASLPRPKKYDSSTMGSPQGHVEVERLSRDRTRMSGVSHSTPGSRSGSPSSLRSGSSYGYHIPESNALIHQRKFLAHSRNSSRETSPIRITKAGLTSITTRRGAGDRPPIQPTSRPILAQKMLAQSLQAEENEGLSLYDADSDSIGHKMSPRKTSYRPFEDHSDDSDASSLCSERSFDSYRRTSDSYSWSGSQQRLYRDVWESGAKDINEILMQCGSTAWSDRKEGLVGLQAWLQAGNTLDPSQLKIITDNFTKMFMDSHTKIFSLFLDTLNELLVVHCADLNSWLYILLTRLLNKLGGDLLGSIQNKIQKSLNTVRVSFPPELQMLSLLRFLTDHTQTPNLRVKTAALNYITKLAAITDPSQAFPQMTPGTSRDPVQAALHKMIGWTMGDGIKQGNELRRAAQEAILALFNLNTPQVTVRLANLPQEYQEAAATLLRCRVRRGSSSSIYNITSSPPSPSSRLPQRQRTHDSDSSLNAEDVYKSLRKTTAEIQNYTFETGTEKPPDKDNTTSKDSGISQLSCTEALEEALEELSIQSSSSSNATTTTLINRVLTVRDCNGVDSTDNNQQEDGPVDEQEAMRKIVEALRSPPDSDNGENISIISESEKRASLSHLTRLIRESSITTLQDNFKSLLRILLGNLTSDASNRDVQTRILVLTALTELIKKRAMTESLNHYVELLILKVLNSYKDTSKEVVRTAEVCANTIATTLAPAMVIRVLAPLIQTGEYPLNLAAVKMLTRLVETCGRDPVYDFLPDLMPGLIQAYDNQESSVRKSAVFCMVSLHAAIGEEDLKPHLTALNGSKLKLLHLYIRRAQQGSSAPTSPRNHPPPSS